MSLHLCACNNHHIESLDDGYVSVITYVGMEGFEWEVWGLCLEFAYKVVCLVC